MIVVRDVFDVYPDRIAEAEGLIRELQTTGVQVGLGPARVMVDRTDSLDRMQARCAPSAP